MRVLFAAHEEGWGGFLRLIRSELPEYEFVATGSYGLESLKGFDVLIPTMARVSREMLETNDRLRLIQQAGAGLEGVDIAAARDLGIYVANVPADISGNADSVAELAIYMLIGLSRDIPDGGEPFPSTDGSSPGSLPGRKDHRHGRSGRHWKSPDQAADAI